MLWDLLVIPLPLPSWSSVSSISTVCIHERINILRCACITAQDFHTHVQATCKHRDFKGTGWQVEKTCQALVKTELPSWPSVMCSSSKDLVKKTDFICRGIKFIIAIFQLHLSRALTGSVSWSYCLNNTLIVSFFYVYPCCPILCRLNFYISLLGRKFTAKHTLLIVFPIDNHGELQVVHDAEPQSIIFNSGSKLLSYVLLSLNCFVSVSPGVHCSLGKTTVLAISMWYRNSCSRPNSFMLLGGTHSEATV